MVTSGRKAAVIAAIALFASISAGVLLHFFLKPAPPHEYVVLDEIKRYAAALPEFPSSDDNDWLDPSYKSFDKTRQPSSGELILERFGLYKRKPWSPPYLANLLRELTKRNNEFGLTQGSNSFVHIRSAEHTRVYVFGDVHGAFHSLIRDLDYLRQTNVIDERLRILDEQTYFIFNGDYINRSPYSIDSLILLATFIMANPKNVFYIAGKHERNSHWVDYGLRRELIERGRLYSTAPIPYQDKINRYFETLPEAIYISAKNSGQEVIRIAFSDQEHLGFDENNLSPRFLEQTEHVKAYEFTPKSPKEPSLDTRAALKTEEWRSSNRIKQGLALLDQDQGATTWAVLSSPTTVHRYYLDFHYDAFALINVGNTIEHASISRIYSDTRNQSGYKEDDPINLISAKTTKVNEKRKIIKTASTMSLMRGVPTIGRQAQRGLDLSINAFNNHNENDNILVRLYVDNDDYVPKIARSNVMKYLDRKIPFLILPIGTPTTLAYIDLVKDKDFAVMFPITGANSLRKPEYRNLVHFRATYEDEVRALITDLRQEYGALKFAFFYQDDAYGRGPFETAVTELKKLGITDVLPLPYTRGSTHFATQIKEFQKTQPDALGFFATATATQELIRQLGAETLTNTKLFAISFAAELTLRRFAAKQGLPILFAAAVPNPLVHQSKIAQNYRIAMDKANLGYDVFSFEAFIASKIFLWALERLGSQEITAHNVLRTIESIKHLNFEGIRLDFNELTRSLAQHVWLESGAHEEWKEYHIH